MESKIVKNAKSIVVGFFVLVFIMGFFSKSIINLFLPKVSIEYAVEGAIERSLNLEGIIEAKKTQKLRLRGEVIIEEYLVKIGDKVEAGMPLFKIDTAYGLKDSRADIEKLNLQIDDYRLRKENLENYSYEIDNKNITAMEGNLQQSRESLAKQQQLFDVGAISQQELEGYKADVQQQELDIEIVKLQLEEKSRKAIADIKGAENEIRSLQLEIQEIRNKQGFYSNVGQDGICYSQVSGVITYINNVQEIVMGDSVLIEIAEAFDVQALTFAGVISEDDYEFVKSAGIVEIEGKNVLDTKYINISSIYKLNNQGTYRVEGIVKDEEQKDFVIGQKLKGIVKQKYTIKGYNKISKSAVIVFGEYKVDAEGTVYLLEESEGVLGKEFRAREMPVKLLAVGDNEIVVSGLEALEEPKVITNLSYKIRDGVKVFLWQ